MTAMTMIPSMISDDNVVVVGCLHTFLAVFVAFEVLFGDGQKMFDTTSEKCRGKYSTLQLLCIRCDLAVRGSSILIGLLLKHGRVLLRSSFPPGQPVATENIFMNELNFILVKVECTEMRYGRSFCRERAE